MQLIRTIVWVVITALLVGFMAMNLEPVALNFWPLSDRYLHLNWPVGLIALVFFLLGLLPMWLIGLIGRWHYKRRISALENSVRAVTAPPLATSTQLDAAASDTPVP